MAKKKKDDAAEGEEGAKKKKKPIVPIVVLLLAGVGAKMTILKDAPAPTQAELDAQEKAAELELYNKCAELNNRPPITAPDPTAVEPTTTTKGKALSIDSHGRLQVRLVAMRQSEGAAAVPIVEGEGPTAELDSVTVNLADGSYLKLGLALQLKEGLTVDQAKTEVGGVAKDLALTTLAPHTMDELTKPATRESMKSDISFDVCRKTDASVEKIYFTEFVMQTS